MNEEELIQILRRTLRSRAASITPSSSARPPQSGHQLRALSEPAEDPGGGGKVIRITSRHRAVLGSIAAAVVLVAGVGTAIAVHLSSGRTNIRTTDSVPPPIPGETASTVPTSVVSAPVVTVTTIPVPTGFEPVSVTFVSASMGWVLGTTRCGAEFSADIVYTTDGGATWGRSKTPPGLTFTAPPNGSNLVSIRFADPNDGWVVAPDTATGGSELFATHNAGQSWASVNNPGGAGATIEDLEADAHVVHIVTLTPGTGADHIYTTQAAADEWTVSPTQMTFGGGPTPSAQIELFGSTGWIIVNNRTALSGAQLTTDTPTATTWTAWTPPCSTDNGPGLLAPASAMDLDAICDVGVMGPPKSPPPGWSSALTAAEYLYYSTNGGTSFTAGPPIPSSYSGITMAAAPASTWNTVVAASSSGLVATFNGGKTWTAVYPVAKPAQITYVGFTTNTQGVAILTQDNGTTTLLMTEDGGRQWSPTSF